MTREELIKKAIDLGRSPDEAAKIADAWIAKQDESKGEKKAEAKPAPKAPPKSATPAPKAPAPKPAPVAPKVVEKETVRVTTAPARVYGAELPDRTREYSDVTPPMTRSRAAEVMPSEVSLTGRGGLWLDREAAAKAQAEDRAREAAKMTARDMLAPEPTPMLDKPAIPSYVTRYGGMGEIRKDEDEIAGMRAAMKAMKPAKAALVDAMDDADVAAAYKRLNAE